VRIAVAKLDSRLLESEELLAAKFSAAQRVADLRELANLVAEGRTRWTEVDLEIRSLCASRGKAPAQEASRPVPGLTRLLDYCAWSLDRSRLLAARMADAIQLAERDRQTTGKLVDDLLEASKKLIMLPFGTISTSFPKLVRDLCRSQGKEASFSIQGVGIEIDKRTLEEIKDALVHLLRNAVDHGIEDPAARARAGKARRGTIRLEVTQGEGNKVQVAVADDGAGIDSGQVKAAAIRRKLVSAEEAARFDEAEALELIFLSEMSTSAVITKVSGRGLGLAIVRERARKLDGEVTVESLQGQGTTFRIVLLAVRSTVRGILFTAAGGTWMVPTPQVDRVLRVHPGDLLVIQGQATLAVAGFRVPLVHLADALGLPAAKRNVMPSTGQQVLVLGTGDRRFAFIVDSILNEQEMLVKALPKPLVRVPNVAAATVLGTGQIVPVLNVSDLLKSAGRSKPPDPNGVAEESPAPGAPRSILVVEDSITSRMLLKGILEAAGYRIKTAADGIEAFTLLRTEPFDLVVSDVEMPRMDGFGLTAKIRSDPGLAQLPVVLVTALETREDRERGVDAGADAYLVKSSFDQSALLETVRRLV
jgi:two-component system chemotaxis sensor kinase CheA